VSSNQPAASYTPATLANNTAYFWQNRRAQRLRHDRRAGVVVHHGCGANASVDAGFAGPRKQCHRREHHADADLGIDRRDEL
jgi:hypothetical protein